MVGVPSDVEPVLVLRLHVLPDQVLAALSESGLGRVVCGRMALARGTTCGSDPEGLLVLHHGRGSDERDLISLSDVLDPEARLHVVSPRALCSPGLAGLPLVRGARVGYPDPRAFQASYAELAALDEARQATGVGPERTVLGGFSMGSVMSYAGLALSAPHRPGSPSAVSSRPSRAGIRTSTAARTRASSSRTAAATR